MATSARRTPRSVVVAPVGLVRPHEGLASSRTDVEGPRDATEGTATTAREGGGTIQFPHSGLKRPAGSAASFNGDFAWGADPLEGRAFAYRALRTAAAVRERPPLQWICTPSEQPRTGGASPWVARGFSPQGNAERAWSGGHVGQRPDTGLKTTWNHNSYMADHARIR